MNKDYKVGNIISIDVEKLWNSLKELETDEIFVDTCSKELLYTTIRSSDDDFYIEGEQSVYACCDGETCKIISIENDKIGLLSLDQDYDNDIFYLSKDELSKATFCIKEA